MMSTASKTTASLSDAKNSKTGLRCHAGCSVESEFTICGIDTFSEVARRFNDRVCPMTAESLAKIQVDGAQIGWQWPAASGPERLRCDERRLGYFIHRWARVFQRSHSLGSPRDRQLY